MYAWKGERGKRMCMPGKEREENECVCLERREIGLLSLPACLSLSPLSLYIYLFFLVKIIRLQCLLTSFYDN